MTEARFGLKAATITPEGKDDVGSPNRLLREAIDGKVIIRTGSAHTGRHAGGGRALPDRRGAHGGGRRLRRRGGPRAAERRRDRVPHRAHLAQHLPGGGRVQLPHGGAHPRPRLRRAEVDGEPGLRGHAEGGDGRGGRAPSRGALQPRPDRRHLRRPDQRRRRRAARDPGAQPRRRLPVRPRDAHVRIDRGSGIGAAGVRRELRAQGGDGGGARTAPRRRCRARTSPTRWR